MKRRHFREAVLLAVRWNSRKIVANLMNSLIRLGMGCNSVDEESTKILGSIHLAALQLALELDHKAIVELLISSRCFDENLSALKFHRLYMSSDSNRSQLYSSDTRLQHALRNLEIGRDADDRPPEERSLLTWNPFSGSNGPSAQRVRSSSGGLSAFPSRFSLQPSSQPLSTGVAGVSVSPRGSATPQGNGRAHSCSSTREEETGRSGRPYYSAYLEALAPFFLNLSPMVCSYMEAHGEPGAIDLFTWSALSGNDALTWQLWPRCAHPIFAVLAVSHACRSAAKNVVTVNQREVAERATRLEGWAIGALDAMPNFDTARYVLSNRVSVFGSSLINFALQLGSKRTLAHTHCCSLTGGLWREGPRQGECSFYSVSLSVSVARFQPLSAPPSLGPSPMEAPAC